MNGNKKIKKIITNESLPYRFVSVPLHLATIISLSLSVFMSHSIICKKRCANESLTNNCDGSWRCYCWYYRCECCCCCSCSCRIFVQFSVYTQHNITQRKICYRIKTGNVIWFRECFVCVFLVLKIVRSIIPIIVWRSYGIHVNFRWCSWM